MKKLFGIFSLLVLTLSNVLPAYTYADTGENVWTIAENMDTAIVNSEIENISNVDEESQNSGSSINTELIGQVDGDANNALSGWLNNEESETNDNQEWAIFWNITESLMSLFWDDWENQNEWAEAGTIKETMLITWYKFAYEVKKLANPSFTEKDNYDNIIKYINRADNDNSNGKTTAIISMPWSEYPVKAWFENVNGDWVIYYYTEANKIYLNPNSSYMFAFYKKLITVDLTQFDSTYVENLSYFFYYDESLQFLDFSKFNTPNLTNFWSIIRWSSSIKEIDLSNFDTSHVTNMNDLFEECTSLETVIIDNRDLRWWSSLWNLGWWIYYNNPKLKYTSAKNWKVPSNLARWLNSFFYGYNWLRWVIDVTDWDTSLVTDMNNAFYGIDELTWVIWLNTWDTSNVTDMNHMFQSSKKLESLDLSWWDTSKVEDMSSMFEYCHSLKEIKWLDTWDTSSLKHMWCMFYECKQLKELNLDGWDVSKVTTSSSESDLAYWWSSAFYKTDSLEKVSFRWWKLPDNLQSRYSSRWLNYSWITSIDVSNWKTSNVKKMNTMFTDIKKNVNIIWLDTWDTSNVENMWWMFTRSYWLESLDLSSFDTSKVTNIQWMFQWASNLRTIYAGDKFIVNDWVPSTDMFSGAVSLIWWNWTEFDENHIDSEYARWDIKGISWYFDAKTYNLIYDANWWTLNWEENTYKQSNKYILPIPTRIWNQFIWWYESWTENLYTYVWLDVKWDKNLYAQWKPLEEKAQETTDSVIYTEDTTVDINDEGEQPITWSTTITLKSKEVESEEVKSEEEKITVKESEIKVTSDKTVEYQWWLEVYLEKTENEKTEIIEWIAKFSSPIAVKIPVSSNSEFVKVQVKHYWEEFWYKWLTLNPVNNCSNWEALNDKYNGENIPVKDTNWEKYALIYTCSASTFVAYIENVKPVVPSPASWGWRTITPTKQETKSVEQEHNSADLEKITVQENAETTINTTDAQSVEEKINKIQWRSLTRWEVAVMTNILLDVYPQLTENRELNEVSKACENYADEQNFTKDEKKAITRLCKLSIMWIHADDNKPLDEFMVNQITKNDEFSKVINRSLSTYTEKDFSAVKDALKKLEWDEDNVVFGTVYDVFMSIKNIFN